jgi:peptidyl-prolyl cis-trans isomerase A (cyclophilin A)
VHGTFTLEQATAGLTGSGPLVATLETSKGTLTCELFGDKTPITVANFDGLARGLRPFRNPNTGNWEKKPFYDGLIFHRVIPNFMIQGGDAAGSGNGIGSAGPKKSAPGYQFDDEIVASLKFTKKGQLAMANRAKEEDGRGTNGSQFFITDAAPSHLNGLHTIFGQCTPDSLVSAIATVPTFGSNRPKDEVTIKHVTIAYKKPGKAAPAKKSAGK